MNEDCREMARYINKPRSWSMNKYEIGRQAVRIDKDRKNIWCPVSRGWCNPACESYVKSLVCSNELHGYILDKGYCDAYILKGNE